LYGFEPGMMSVDDEMPDQKMQLTGPARSLA
jgi:hypothetical protein